MFVCHISRAQLHDYIYDYLVKMNFKDAAFAFADESKIITSTADDSQHTSNKNSDTLSASLDSLETNHRTEHPQKSPLSSKKRSTAALPFVKVPIDAPGGFLYEWWVIFWDIFAAKNNRSTNRDAIAYVEAQQVNEPFLLPLFWFAFKILIATKYIHSFTTIAHRCLSK